MQRQAEVKYERWSHDALIQRVTSLEKQLREQTSSTAPLKQASPNRAQSPEPEGSRKKKEKKEFDFSRYSTRYIALKFAYLGQGYNGYEHHIKNNTRLPTVEEVLWRALTKTKLISPKGEGQVNWDGVEYSKCGRTDKGVSAFGQVVSLRVRSNRPKPKARANAVDADDGAEGANTESRTEQDIVPDEDQNFDDIADEITYVRNLNHVLPDDIRVLAWCPSIPPDFSARFSCRERRYRYFFTQPAYAPRSDTYGLQHLPNGTLRKDGWLDIAAMREAAAHYVGVHDFRNFCKIDAARQITNFVRRVTFADIEEAKSSSGIVAHVSHPGYASMPPEDAKVYTFTVYGSAFLYHQVRCMVAILFLVGSGLEKPSVVKEMLDVERNPTKPMYEMADDAPLVLWDCIFPDLDMDEQKPPEMPKEDAMQWIYPDMQPAVGRSNDLAENNGRFGHGAVQEVCWSNWRAKKIDEVVAASLLDVVAMQRPPQVASSDLDQIGKINRSTKIFDGSNNYRSKGEYMPLLKRERLEPVEVINARYLTTARYLDRKQRKEEAGEWVRDASLSDHE